MRNLTSTLPQSMLNTRDGLRMNAFKILLVGNNPLELGQYSKALLDYPRKNFSIDTAFNNEECYKKASKYKPSAIILDDSVGFMNLMEISEKLHKDSRFVNIPVIVLKSSNYHHASMSENVADFLIKEGLQPRSLGEIVLKAISDQKLRESEMKSRFPDSLDKRMSKLFVSLFGPKNVSAS